MQRIGTHTLFVVLLLLFLSACRTGYEVIRGRVIDPSDQPVANVEVRLPGRPPLRTGANGEFVIYAPPAAERLAVSFSATGFIDTTRVLPRRERAAPLIGVILWPRAVPQTLNAGRGGSLDFPAGRLTIPPGALVDGRGRTIEGDVQVSFSAFDVTDPRQYRNAPGDFTARMRDGSIQQLETFGVFEVYAEDVKRTPVNLRRGASAGVRLIVPEKIRSAVPSAVGSFTFETTTGLWIEQEPVFQSDQRQAVAGPINTFGRWNADQVLRTTCIRVIAECGCPEAADPGFYVDGQGFGYSHTFTTQSNPCVNVKKNASVLLTPADTDFQPALIKTPNAVANCTSPGGCKDVKFHCPTQAMLDDPLNVIQEPPWWRAFGFPTTDPAFDTTWQQSQVGVDGLGSLTLQLDPCTTFTPPCFNEGFRSGQYQTTCYYGYGTYEATFRAAKGPGLVTSFFTFTNEPRHDEIDFEILGRPIKPSDGCSSSAQGVLQTNYFVDGDGSLHEKITCLEYDPFTTSRTYKFVWSADGIEWFADADNDGVMESIRRLSLIDGDPGPFPTQPGKMFVNLWAIDNLNSGAVSAFGTFDFSTTPQPIKAWYDHITYTP